MEFDAIIAVVAGLHPIVKLIFVVLGALVVLAQGIVAMTPSKKDDEFWAKLEAKPVIGPLLVAVSKLAPFQKK